MGAPESGMKLNPVFKDIKWNYRNIDLRARCHSGMLIVYAFAVV